MLPIPNTLSSKHQPQHFDWWLSPILLDSGHVDIVDKVDEFFARRRDKSDRPVLPEVL